MDSSSFEQNLFIFLEVKFFFCFVAFRTEASSLVLVALRDTFQGIYLSTEL